jgi:hypothetical protein
MINPWSDEGLPALYFKVTQLLANYARGVDRRDWELLRSLFHTDSVDEHGFTAGGVEEFIERFSARSAGVLQMMHLNGNTLIRDRNPERREVLVESSCVAWNRVLPGGFAQGSLHDSPLIPHDSPHARVSMIGNRYLDLLSEREGELRFTYRRVIFEFAAVVEVGTDSPFGPESATGSRNADDPGYITLEEFRDQYLECWRPASG